MIIMNIVNGNVIILLNTSLTTMFEIQYLSNGALMEKMHDFGAVDIRQETCVI